METSELTGAALDWAVAKAAKQQVNVGFRNLTYTPDDKRSLYSYSPSTNWAQGGPLIEREQLELRFINNKWFAEAGDGTFRQGETPLIAAMRCFVTVWLGREIDLPGEVA
jgi:hypothetical protein